MRLTKIRERKERRVKKKPLGRSGMQRTAAGSYEQGKAALTLRETRREISHERRTITVIKETERSGYFPIGRTEANILST